MDLRCVRGTSFHAGPEKVSVRQSLAPNEDERAGAGTAANRCLDAATATSIRGSYGCSPAFAPLASNRAQTFVATGALLATDALALAAGHVFLGKRCGLCSLESIGVRIPSVFPTGLRRQLAWLVHHALRRRFV